MDRTLLAHLLVRRRKQDSVVVGESYAPARCSLFDGDEVLASLHVPEDRLEIQTSGRQQRGGAVDIAARYGLVSSLHFILVVGERLDNSVGADTLTGGRT
eukprot:101776_1